MAIKGDVESSKKSLSGLVRKLRFYAPLRWLLLCPLLAYLGIAAAPTMPHLWGIGLDASWVAGLNMAHRDGLVHGTDIIWTYGPLGHLRYFDPASGQFGSAVVYRLGLYFLWLAAASRLLFRLRSRAAAAVWAFVLSALVGIADFTMLDHLELAVIAVTILALSETGCYREWAIFVLGLVSALALLVKLNSGVESWLLFGLVVSIAAWRQRGGSKSAVRYAAFRVAAGAAVLVVLYGLATGSLRGLPGYLFYGWQIASGFSQSMSLPGPLWQLSLAVLSIVGLLVWLPLACDERKSLVPGLLLACVLAFFSFKIGMVRQDGHAVNFQFSIALAALPVSVLAKTLRDRYLYFGCQLASLMLGCSICFGSFPGYLDLLKQRFMLQNARNAVSVSLHAKQAAETLEARSAARSAQLKMDARFTDEIRSATIDAIPWDLGRILGNGWNWRPRPVIQSYAAYTPVLDRLNADHLRSSRAARWILLTWFFTDMHHPFVEDVSTWPALLERYDLKLLDSEDALLCRRDQPRQSTTRALESRDIRWNQPLSLPATERMLVMNATIAPSVYGLVRNLVYRTDAVWMDVTYSTGRKASWRVVWPNLRSGFIVNPLPQNLSEFACLFGGAACGERVATAAFRAQTPFEFRPVIHVTVSEMEFSRGQAVSAAPAFVRKAANPGQPAAPAGDGGKFPRT